MSLVTFRRHYCGLLTQGHHYQAGDVVELPDYIAAQLAAKDAVTIAVKASQGGTPDDTGAAAPSPAASVVSKPKRTKSAGAVRKPRVLKDAAE